MCLTHITVRILLHQLASLSPILKNISLTICVNNDVFSPFLLKINYILTLKIPLPLSLYIFISLLLLSIRFKMTLGVVRVSGHKCWHFNVW